MESLRMARTALAGANSSKLAIPRVCCRTNGCRRSFARISVAPTTPVANTVLAPRYTSRAPSLQLPSEPFRRRLLHTTPVLGKKARGAKAAKNSTATDEDADENGASGTPTTFEELGIDPYDMTDVEESQERAGERAEEKLQSLRHGGRFSADSIERIPVVVDKKTSPHPVPLSEVALVDIKGGRVVQLTLFEAAHRKAVVAAIQASADFNQQPQPDADDPAILTLKVEPEVLEDQLKRAKDACHGWRESLRKVSSARQKKHQQWKKQGLLRGDDFVALGKELQKLQDKRMEAVDAAEKSIVQTLKKNHGNTF